MTSANASQIAYWNGPIGQEWAREQAKRDRDHETVTRAVLALAAPQPGEYVLDIGCGSGTTTMLTAGLVGSKGRATGFDISKPMLELATLRARERHSTATFVEADVTDYRFEPQSVDLIFSQFGVMFFADPVAALTNLHRALRPGGRITFACWRQHNECGWAHIPEGAARPFLPQSPPSDPIAPGRYAFANPDRVKSILLQAGFHDATLEKFDCPSFAGRTPQEAASSAIHGGPLMRTLADADEATRVKVRHAVEERLAKEMQPEGIFLTQAVWLVAARA